MAHAGQDASARRRGTLGALAYLGAAAGLMAIFIYLVDRHVGGPLDDVFLTSEGLVGAVDPSLFIDLDLYSHRLTLVDPATGQRRARRVLGRLAPHCVEVQSGHLWCRTGEELALLDRTLEVAAGWSALRRAMPELGPGLRHRDLVELVDGQLYVETNDGRHWLLDAATLRATSAPRNAKRVDPVRPSEAAPDRLALYDRRGAPATLDDGALTLQITSAKGARDRVQLTREGSQRWTRDLGRGHARFCLREKDLLVVVGNLPDAVAIGLDAATGAERFRTAF